VFTLGPIVASFCLSFARYNLASRPQFVGLENYRKLPKDPLFLSSLWRTTYYSLASVPVGLSGSLVAAILLNQKIKAQTLFRVIFFLPSLTPVVSSAILWRWIFQPEIGLLNQALARIGVMGPGWLGSTTWAIPALIIISLWGGIGGSSCVIFLAGLQGVPQELYEAAEIDGGNAWAKFRHITIPMLSPVVFFNLIVGVIGSFSVFTVAFITTQGGPAYATWFYALHIYTVAFRYYEFGPASALAWVFFAIVLVLSIVQLKLADKWVYYEGGLT